MTEKIAVKKLNDKAIIPTYGTEFSAGADIYACLQEPVTIGPGEAYMVHTGIAVEIPVGYAGLIYARSGMAVKRGLAPSNKVGVIDADYRGEIMVQLFNQSKQPQTIEPGERIAQMVVTPFLKVLWEECGELSETVRGAGGFGSTGKN
ncbi:MAG: dUTP diphosphatase [Parasporobacterium sp.]|nr:dUTP diphosphatase [Parasporobacterium sp.]